LHASSRLRPAGIPVRETGSERNPYDTALPQAPQGPRAAVRDCKRTGAGRPRPRRENEVLSMATIIKIRNKIERASALNGWRMRWHMQ
jgi:hypothetical protein